MTQRDIREGKRRVKAQGPCLICCRHPFAYHRLFDAQFARLVSGESVESICLDYEEGSVEDMVGRWYGFLEALYDIAGRDNRTKRAIRKAIDSIVRSKP